MSMTDPIADLLTRIRNALQARHEQVVIPYSRIKAGIARCLEQEGFVRGVDIVGEGVKKGIVVTLKYSADRESAIIGLRRVSTPGRRVYRSHDELRFLRHGTGLSILSTPQGVMKDSDAKRSGVGGEVLVAVW